MKPSHLLSARAEATRSAPSFIWTAVPAVSAALLVVLVLSLMQPPTTVASQDVPWNTMNVTAYCDYGTMASGWYTHNGALAASREIPFGSLVEIQGLGTFRVEDRGGAITPGHLDVWMPACSTAVQFGRRYLNARILRYGWWGN